MITQLVQIVLPIEGSQIFLVRAGVPFGDIVGVELDAEFGHFLDDFFVSFVVAKEAVDEHALVAGELGDFALGATLAARLEGIFDF